MMLHTKGGSRDVLRPVPMTEETLHTRICGSSNRPANGIPAHVVIPPGSARLQGKVERLQVINESGGGNRLSQHSIFSDL